MFWCWDLILQAFCVTSIHVLLNIENCVCCERKANPHKACLGSFFFFLHAQHACFSFNIPSVVPLFLMEHGKSLTHITLKQNKKNLKHPTQMFVCVILYTIPVFCGYTFCVPLEMLSFSFVALSGFLWAFIVVLFDQTAFPSVWPLLETVFFCTWFVHLYFKAKENSCCIYDYFCLVCKRTTYLLTMWPLNFSISFQPWAKETKGFITGNLF